MDEHGAVLRISTGLNHSLAVTRDGAVFSWGCGRESQLGHASYSDQAYPRQIMALSNPAIHIIQASAGRGHSAFLTKTGFVLTCGSNQMGELGVHPATTGCPALSNAPSIVPQVVSDLASHFVIQLACGESHTAALTSNGQVYAWGNNLQHQSASDGSSNTLLHPTPCPGIDTAVHIHAGASHTMVLGSIQQDI